MDRHIVNRATWARVISASNKVESVIPLEIGRTYFASVVSRLFFIDVSSFVNSC